MIFLPLADLFASEKENKFFLKENIIINISLHYDGVEIIIGSGIVQKSIKAETLLWNILEPELIPIKTISKEHVLFNLL